MSWFRGRRIGEGAVSPDIANLSALGIGAMVLTLAVRMLFRQETGWRQMVTDSRDDASAARADAAVARADARQARIEAEAARDAEKECRRRLAAMEARVAALEGRS